MHAANGPTNRVANRLTIREIKQRLWKLLNELRGVCGSASCYKPSNLTGRMLELRDCLAACYAFEWGGNGPLRNATLQQTLPTFTLNQLLDEQMHLYKSISEMATDLERMQRVPSTALRTIPTIPDRLASFDSKLIAHESRKARLLSHAQR